MYTSLHTQACLHIQTHTPNWWNCSEMLVKFYVKQLKKYLFQSILERISGGFNYCAPFPIFLCTAVVIPHCSSLQGVNGKPTYIASQGPLPHTTTDFWRMLWKYDIYVVIMVCRETELDRVSCHLLRTSSSLAFSLHASAIRNSISLPAFRSRLKTHLFRRGLSLCCRSPVFIVLLFQLISLVGQLCNFYYLLQANCL